MVVSAMRDIVADVYPNIKRFVVNGSAVAGALVYLSEPGGVTMTYNASCSGLGFAGVALASVADNAMVAVAMPPTIVYVTNISKYNISAGSYLMPSDDPGKSIIVNAGPINIIGKVLDFYSSSINKVMLMDVPNASV